MQTGDMGSQAHASGRERENQLHTGITLRFAVHALQFPHPEHQKHLLSARFS